MLQADSWERDYTCTCFIFMKPTENMKRLLTKWIQAITDDSEAMEDQASCSSDALFSTACAGLPSNEAGHHHQ